jgi:hypothetical protein
MGTEISLSVGYIDVQTTKNFVGMDHGFLFQENDRMRLSKNERVNEGSGLRGVGFEKPLKDVVSRLGLSGHHLASVEEEYKNICRKYIEYYDNEDISCVSFERIIDVFMTINLMNMDSTFNNNYGNKEKESFSKEYLPDILIKDIPHDVNYLDHDHAYTDRDYFEALLLDSFSPYSQCVLLYLNPGFKSEVVTWDYGDLVESGWEKEEYFIPDARRKNRFILVTEGHTDVAVIELALLTLRPEIHDFFTFIDMTSGHPFGGTSNLLKFAKGLALMDVHNKTLFLYDNDTEGLSAFNKTYKFDLPGNMGAALLPDLPEFENFDTLGPTGHSLQNINGKAVAIECYLDLYRPNLPEKPVVRWGGFKGDVKQYQGALADKERYMQDFLSHSPEELLSNGYNLQKLKLVIDTIYDRCIQLNF